MKKKFIISTCILGLTAGVSYAAMGTGLGLPNAWSLAVAKGYGAKSVSGNPASAMCVECHTVNPSGRIAVPSNTNGLANTVIGRLAAVSQGSHTVINSDSATALDSNTGGGFPGSYLGALDTGKYLPKAAWGSTGSSKYQADETGVLASTTTATAGSVGLICESCHSVRFNYGNNLLLDAYVDNGDSTLCINCHSSSSSPLGFHTNDNLTAFSGSATTPKRHHVMTDGTNIDQLINNATHYNGGGTASWMWAPSASDKLDATWCAGGTPGPYGVVAAPTVTVNLVGGTNIAFRDACNVAGQGTWAAADVSKNGTATVAGDIATTGNVNCANCHRPHNAATGSGAFILRTGTGGAYTQQNPASANFAIGSVSADQDYILYGIRRQADVGNHSTTKIYGEYLPLCNGCHRGYGN